MDMQPSYIESEVTGLSIYRSSGYFNNVSAQELCSAVYELDADVFKFKVTTSFEDLFRTLTMSNFPFEIQNIIEKNVVEVPRGLSHPEMDGVTVERASLHHKADLDWLIAQILDESTSVKYRSLFQIYSHQQYVQITQGYLTGFLNCDRRAVWIVRDQGTPIAYFSGVFQHDSFEGVLFGVRPDYRKRGMSHFIYNMTLSICSKLGLRQFISDVEIHNVGSIRAARGIGMKPELYYHINCFGFLGRSTLMEQSVWMEETKVMRWTHSFRNYQEAVGGSSIETVFWKKVLSDERAVFGKRHLSGLRTVGHELLI